MKEIFAFIRHNSGIVIGSILCILTIVWVYGCPSRVTSITKAPELVTRAELEIEVDYFLEMAEVRFAELDQQDEFKRTIFAFAISLLESGSLNPGAVALVLGNLLGLGAIIDNVRKRTYINTLKGETFNGRVKEKVKKVNAPSKN